MPIPEAQLETWSHQGSVTQSSSTYNTIKSVLENSTTPYAGKKFEVFLQGSYGNSTNIYAESDVDIVIQLDDCFHRDLSMLTAAEKALYWSAFPDTAIYTDVDFKRDVLSVLKEQYGSAVKAGDKAIAIDGSGSRRKADVIVAIQFRRYLKFRSSNDFEFVEGICFRNGSGELISNYPKQHSANLTKKHQNTSEWFKPTVRVFKNIRSQMVDKGLIKSGIAPSYYIEGLLYNVPDGKLANSYNDSVVNTLNWYLQEASKTNLLCANKQQYLLKDGCWNQANCDVFVEAAVKFWNLW